MLIDVRQERDKMTDEGMVTVFEMLSLSKSLHGIVLVGSTWHCSFDVRSLE